MAIAFGFAVAVFFYESLCHRDVLVGRTMRWIHRRSSGLRIWATVYALVVAVGIPMLVTVWATVIAFALLFVGSVERIGNVGDVAVTVVAATRILAYVRTATSHELAKAIPLSLGFAFLTGGSANIVANLAFVTDRPEFARLTNAHVLFLVGLEITLRLIHDGFIWLRGRRRGRPGVVPRPGDLGAPVVDAADARS